MASIEEKLNEPGRPRMAPTKYAGLWIAWNADQTEVIASGRDSATVRAAAIAAGQPLALLERVRRPDELCVGRT